MWVPRPVRDGPHDTAGTNEPVRHHGLENPGDQAGVNGLILVTEPLLAVLMLGRLGFAPWQFGLAFALPCVGGLIGSRLARRLVARSGQRKVMLTAGALRACWLLGLAFIRPGAAGIVLVIAVQLGLVTCMDVFNPVLATYQLEHIEKDLLARTLSAWSVTSNLTVAALTAFVGHAGQRHQPPHRDRDCRPVHPGHPRYSSPATTARSSPSGNWPGAVPDAGSEPCLTPARSRA